MKKFSLYKGKITGVFNDAKHEYRGTIEGEPVKKIVTCSEVSGLGSNIERVPNINYYAEIGTEVHRYIYHYLDKDLAGFKFNEELSEEQIDEVVKTIPLFEDFIRDTEPKEFLVIDKEFITGSITHKVIGTVDLYCEINKSKVIIDWKTSSAPTKSNKTQIAGYCLCMEEEGYKYKIDYCLIVNFCRKTKKYKTYKMERKEITENQERFKLSAQLLNMKN